MTQLPIHMVIGSGVWRARGRWLLHIQLILLSLEMLVNSSSVTVSIGRNGQAAHLRVGHAASLKCVLDGSAKSTATSYRWTKNGRQLTISSSRLVGLSTPRLVIFSLTKSDSGLYRCHVTFSNEKQVQGEGQLQVFDDPRIIVHANVKVRETRKATLVCRGTDYERIFWYKDGKYLNSNPNFKTDSITAEELILKNASLLDSGVYICEAKNSAGGVGVAKVSLTVETSPKVLSHPQDAKVPQSGFDAVFNCSVAGIPTPRVTWKRGSTGRQIDTKISKFTISKRGLYGSELTITNVHDNDKDVYFCVGLNDHGEKESRRAQLTVGLEPSIIGVVAYKTIKYSKNDTIFCTLNGVLNPTVTWMRDGLRLHDPAIFQKATGELVITKALYEHTGVYVCKINVSPMGVTLMQTTHVTVRGPPDPPYLLTPVLVDNGSTGQTFKWLPPLFSGNNPITQYTVHWKGTRAKRASGENLSWQRIPTENLTVVLDFSEYVKQSSGNYLIHVAVTAHNSFGESDYSNSEELNVAAKVDNASTSEMPTIISVPVLSARESFRVAQALLVVGLSACIMVVCGLGAMFIFLNRNRNRSGSLVDSKRVKPKIEVLNVKFDLKKETSV